MLTRRHTRNRSSASRSIFVVYTILFLCCSTHFALEFTHYYKVLVRARHDLFEAMQSPEHPLQSTTGVKGFSLETNELKAADFLITVTDFLGEVILIYRCWLLWSKNYSIIILPSLAAIGSIGKIPGKQSMSF
jgi:hypothetical protein